METLFIKNMVCNRCIKVVQQELEGLGLHVEKIVLGQVDLNDMLTVEKINAIDEALMRNGFERIDSRKSRLIESIKKLVIDRVHHNPDGSRKLNWSSILSEELHLDYNYLSGLFSSVEGVTLEQYIIHQKIEKAKELLFYDELTLTQIAERLGYSSVAHLSNQFKKITGLSPSHFKKLKKLRRSSLENV